MDLHSEFHKLSKRIPLTLKMVLLTIIVGLIAWAVLDYFQTIKLREVFLAQLSEELNLHAIENRLSFDKYVRAHHDSVKLFVTQKNFGDYIESQDWPVKDSDNIKYYRQHPEWFPKRSVLRLLVQPRFAILLDAHRNTREVFMDRQDALPASLLALTPLMIEKIHNQSFMTFQAGVPYLITAESYFNYRGKLQATLIFASPIDDEFFIDSLGILSREHLVALLTPGENSHIITSSNLEELPVGTLLDTLRDQYLVAGKEFFDYGASELQVKFATFVSSTKIDLLTKPVISRARQERAVTAITLILTLAFIMYWITRHIKQLTQRITDFSQQVLGIKPKKLQRGDQLQILEESFQDLIKELKKSQEQLIQSEKLSAMGKLAAGLAHELNSPLAGMLPLLAKYRNREKTDSNEHSDMILMSKACEHMAKIVKDFGYFSRQGKREFIEISIEQAIEDTLSFSASLLSERAIKIIRDYRDKPTKIQGDKTELQQVVLNLISNARDAMPDGGELIIRTGLSEDKSEVLMEFIDNGTGINKEHLGRVFDPFFSTKPAGEGIGLGLSVTYGIVMKHKGKISVDSEMGKGTKFKLSFPAVVQHKQGILV